MARRGGASGAGRGPARGALRAPVRPEPGTQCTQRTCRPAPRARRTGCRGCHKAPNARTAPLYAALYLGARCGVARPLCRPFHGRHNSSCPRSRCCIYSGASEPPERRRVMLLVRRRPRRKETAPTALQASRGQDVCQFERAEQSTNAPGLALRGDHESSQHIRAADHHGGAVHPGQALARTIARRAEQRGRRHVPTRRQVLGNRQRRAPSRAGDSGGVPPRIACLTRSGGRRTCRARRGRAVPADGRLLER